MNHLLKNDLTEKMNKAMIILEKELSGSGFIVVKSENVIFDSSSNYIVLVCKINI